MGLMRVRKSNKRDEVSDPQSEPARLLRTFILFMHLIATLSIWGCHVRRESNTIPKKVKLCKISMSRFSILRVGEV